ncbi:MAG: MBOAT family protein [Bacteriovoracaceae bacterium]
MLFNSLAYFYFIAAVLAIYYSILNLKSKTLWVIWFLTSASIFFYAYWNVFDLFIFLSSIGVNYLIGKKIYDFKRFHGSLAKRLLQIGISGNLLLLIFYKYSDFLIENTNHLFGFSISSLNLALPLAISFFTFQQIAFLVDVYTKDDIKDFYTFSDYIFFVSFFPHLIAGPIVLHKELIPQIKNVPTFTSRMKENIQKGFSIFILGLFKKVIFAETFANSADHIFNSSQIAQFSSFEVWKGVLSYTFQIYFDFSAYSDMAIGSALALGFVLPINFNSPYKASSIIDFWRRWHISLSSFLRDYLYIPLGGNRDGNLMRYRNLFLTMLLGGIWHGAGWNFLIWGFLHGSYLTFNHLWREKVKFKLPDSLSYFITFICVVNAWVFFRATTFSSAFSILKSMYSFSGFSLNRLMTFNEIVLISILGALVAFKAPNNMEVFEIIKSNRKLKWQESTAWALSLGLCVLTIFLYFSNENKFIYFQF